MMQYRIEKQNTDSDRSSTLDSSAASAVRVGVGTMSQYRDVCAILEERVHCPDLLAFSIAI